MIFFKFSDLNWISTQEQNGLERNKSKTFIGYSAKFCCFNKHFKFLLARKVETIPTFHLDQKGKNIN